MTTPANLPHRLDRTLLIHARRETVFRFFTDSARWASWWGEGSSIDPRPGGAVVIRYPGAVEARGEIIEIAAPERFTFTYGYATGSPISPGASLVTIRLEAVGAGTRIHLTHAFTDAAVRDEHVQGWRYQLALFSNAVSNEVCANASDSVDAWLDAWSDADESEAQCDARPHRDSGGAIQGSIQQLSKAPTTCRRISTPRGGSCRAFTCSATARSGSVRASPWPTGSRGRRMARNVRAARTCLSSTRTDGSNR